MPTGHLFSRQNLETVVSKIFNIFINCSTCKILYIGIGSCQALLRVNKLIVGYFLPDSIPFSIVHTWQDFQRGFFHYTCHLIIDVVLDQCLY